MALNRKKRHKIHLKLIFNHEGGTQKLSSQKMPKSSQKSIQKQLELTSKFCVRQTLWDLPGLLTYWARGAQVPQQFAALSSTQFLPFKTYSAHSWFLSTHMKNVFISATAFLICDNIYIFPYTLKILLGYKFQEKRWLNTLVANYDR